MTHINSRKCKLIYSDIEQLLPGERGWDCWRRPQKDTRKLLRVLDMITILTLGMILWMYKRTKLYTFNMCSLPYTSKMLLFFFKDNISHTLENLLHTLSFSPISATSHTSKTLQIFSSSY